MKSSIAVAMIATGLMVSGTAFAQQGYYPQPYPEAGYGQQGQYEYARVIRVDPVYDSRYSTASNRQRCYQQPVAYGNGQYPNNNGYYGNGGYTNGYYGNNGYYGGDQRYGGSQVGRNVATVVGGIAGAVLGSKMGGGTGSYAASAIGGMVGGMAGRGIYDRVQENRYGNRTGTVTVCDPEPVRGTYAGGSGTTAYDVTYEYGGRQYTSRMNYHPGDRVRVRVDVIPQ